MSRPPAPLPPRVHTAAKNSCGLPGRGSLHDPNSRRSATGRGQSAVPRARRGNCSGVATPPSASASASSARKAVGIARRPTRRQRARPPELCRTRARHSPRRRERYLAPPRREPGIGRARGYSRSMTALADASLNAGEWRVVQRFVELLRKEFGADVRGVWLYGSRARGERPHEESDVDLLVVLAREPWQDHWRAARLAYDAAEAEGESPVWFSVQVYTPERLAQRREIRSFFIQDVDRDKVVLFGEP